MVGKGQPPKKPEDIRKAVVFYASSIDRKKMETAKNMECGESASFSTYLKDIVMEHVERILDKNN